MIYKGFVEEILGKFISGLDESYFMKYQLNIDLDLKYIGEKARDYMLLGVFLAGVGGAAMFAADRGYNAFNEKQIRPQGGLEKSFETPFEQGNLINYSIKP